MYSEKHININIPSSSVVFIHQVGSEICKPGHSFGPAVRDHYLIHCILYGEGTFTVGKRKYRLKQGEGFLIIPGVVTYYQADQTNPWEYCWVGFNGTDAKTICDQCGISLDNPILNFKNATKMMNCIRDLSENYDKANNKFTTLSRLYEFFSMIQKEEIHMEKSIGLVDLALDYINKNYSYGISVNQIAGRLCVSRSHLFRIFKENIGLSVQDYLLSFRLERAENLISKTDMSIKEVMYSCGFNDLPNFSRQFRRVYSMPPRIYRNYKNQKPD